MSAITFLQPSRFASMAERMLTSSALVNDTNTSELSMFSSSSSSSSAASPLAGARRDPLAEIPVISMRVWCWR